MAKCTHGLVGFCDSVFLDVHVVREVEGDVGPEIFEVGGEINE